MYRVERGRVRPVLPHLSLSLSLSLFVSLARFLSRALSLTHSRTLSLSLRAGSFWPGGGTQLNFCVFDANEMRLCSGRFITSPPRADSCCGATDSPRKCSFVLHRVDFFGPTNIVVDLQV